MNGQHRDCNLTDEERQSGRLCRSMFCGKCNEVRRKQQESKLKLNDGAFTGRTLKHNKIGSDLCPCCGRQVFLLEDGTWTHLFSKAFREATKRDNPKGAIKFDESDKADKILEKLGKLKCDFSSVEIGDIKDLKEYNKIMEPIRELKKEDMDKLRRGLNTDEPLKTIQRLLILHEVRLDVIYYISQELRDLFKW